MDKLKYWFDINNIKLNIQKNKILPYINTLLVYFYRLIIAIIFINKVILLFYLSTLVMIWSLVLSFEKKFVF